MKESKKVTDGALLIAIYIVLLLMAIFIPFMVTIGIFLLPIPFIIYASRHGFKATILMFIGALLLSSLFATVITLPLTVLVGLGGLMGGMAIHKNLTAYETWGRGTVGFVVGLVFVFAFSQFVLNINWSEEFDVVIEDSIKMSQTIMQQAGLDAEEEQLDSFKEQMKTVKLLLPSSIAIFSIILAFISQWLSYKLINRIENKQLAFPPFRKFNLPVATVWIYFVALIIAFTNLDENSTLYIAIANILTLLVALMALQGFSFIFFYAHYKNISKAVPIIIVVASFLLPFLFLFLVRILGIIDIGFSLKERIAKEKT